jgi:nucleotidyltransferase substrate binding protein (TIGR01987 family)
MTDCRWQQRYDNYVRALNNLTRAVTLAETRELSELEQQGLIQSFEFTHELAWNVLRDFLKDKGFSDLMGSKDTTRMAFKEGLIRNGDAWMAMITARNLSSHTYNIDVVLDMVEDILNTFYPLFMTMRDVLAAKKDTP